MRTGPLRRWRSGVGVLAAFTIGCDPGPGTRVGEELLCDDVRGLSQNPVRYRGSVGQVFWTGGGGCLGAGSLEENAIRFMEATSFEGAGGSERWVLHEAYDATVDAAPDDLGRVRIRLAEEHGSIPVIGGEVIVQLVAATREVSTVSGAVIPVAGVSTAPRISASEAMTAAAGEVGWNLGETLDEAMLVFAPTRDGDVALAWSQRLAYTDAAGFRDQARVFADALTGALIDAHPLDPSALSRRVYDAGNDETLRGNTLLLAEGGSRAAADPETVAVWGDLAHAYDYFRNVHGRDSYDAHGGRLDAHIHYGLDEPLLRADGTAIRQPFNNARWIAKENAMIFGPNWAVRDIITHELGHGVTRHTADLTYEEESGAVNEAMSDIFSVASDLRQVGFSGDAWLMGEQTEAGGSPIRSIRNPLAIRDCCDFYPGRELAPDERPANGPTGNDYGYVHSNSGIANLAFALLVEGGRHPRVGAPSGGAGATEVHGGIPDVEVSALGLDAADRIFYRALATYLTARSDFEALRYATAQAAYDLGGAEVDYDIVHRAWDAVGVPGGAAECDEQNRSASAPSDDAGPCSAFTACDACVTRYPCGWCDGRCAVGSADGPAVGTCGGSWSYTPGECTQAGEDVAGVSPAFTVRCVAPRRTPRKTAGASGCAAVSDPADSWGPRTGPWLFLALLILQRCRRPLRQKRASVSPE